MEDAFLGIALIGLIISVFRVSQDLDYNQASAPLKMS